MEAGITNVDSSSLSSSTVDQVKVSRDVSVSGDLSVSRDVSVSRAVSGDVSSQVSSTPEYLTEDDESEVSDYDDGSFKRVPRGKILTMPRGKGPCRTKRPSGSDTDSLSSLSSIAEDLEDIKCPRFEIIPKSDRRLAWTHVNNDQVMVSPRREKLVLRALSKVGHPHIASPQYNYGVTCRQDGAVVAVGDNRAGFGENIVGITKKRLERDLVVNGVTKATTTMERVCVGSPPAVEKDLTQHYCGVVTWRSSTPVDLVVQYKVCSRVSYPAPYGDDSASNSSTSSADTVLVNPTKPTEEPPRESEFDSLEWNFDDIQNELVIPCPIEFESMDSMETVTLDSVGEGGVSGGGGGVSGGGGGVSGGGGGVSEGQTAFIDSPSNAPTRTPAGGDSDEYPALSPDNQRCVSEPRDLTFYTDGTKVAVIDGERPTVTVPRSSTDRPASLEYHPPPYKPSTLEYHPPPYKPSTLENQPPPYKPSTLEHHPPPYKPSTLEYQTHYRKSGNTWPTSRPPPPPPPASYDKRFSDCEGSPRQGPRQARSHSVSSLKHVKAYSTVESHQLCLKVPPSPPLRSVMRSSRSTPDFSRAHSPGKRVSFGDIRLGSSSVEVGQPQEEEDTSSLQPPISTTICTSPLLRPKFSLVQQGEGEEEGGQGEEEGGQTEFPPQMEDFSTHTYGVNTPRTVILPWGFEREPGNTFSIAQSHENSSLEFTPTADFPALQYLDRVDRGSMADKAGLKPSDFVLEINGENVVNATHEHTVELIKRSGDTLAMRVITVKPLSTEGHERDIHMDGTRTLPLKKKALAPAPPKRHPHTSLTNSVAGKAKTMIDSLAELDRLDRTLALYDDTDSRSVGPMQSSSALDSAAARRGVDPNNKTASIRSRHSGKRLTAFEIEGMFADQAALAPKPVVVVPPKTYTSPTEQKVARMKGRVPANGTASLSRARSTPSLVPGSMGSPLTSHPHHVTRVVIQDGGAPDDGRVMYESPASSPGYQSIASPEEALYAVPMKPKMSHREQSPVYAETGIPPHPRDAPPRPPSSQGSHYSGDSIPPPPSHPPPVPPTRGSSQAGEVVKINTSSPTYANVSQQIQQQQAMKRQSSIESSFRPGAAARMTKEPAVLPPTSQMSRLNNSVSSTSTMSSTSDHYAPIHTTVHRTEQYVIEGHASSRNTQDSVHENARRFMQENANSSSVLATASHGRESQHPPPPTSRAQYYEPEPDYDIVAREQAPKEVLRQSPVTVLSRHSPSPVTSRHSPSPVVGRQSPASSVSRNSPSPAVSRQSASPAHFRRSPSVEKMPENVSKRVDVVRHVEADVRRVDVEESRFKVEQEAQSVQSIREAWQSKQVRKSIDETDKTVVVSPKSVTPKEDERSMSAFGNAIKAAAAAREKKKEDEVYTPKVQEVATKKVPSPPPAPPIKKHSTPPPPPPGPPPPILSSTPPSSQPPTIRKNHLPPHVQKSLEENRQREDTHAAIMAAVARRRNIVENENMEKVADNIENKVQKAKKLQSTVYKSDAKKEVVSPPANPVQGNTGQETKAFRKAPTPPPKATTVESSVTTTEVVRSEVVTMETKPEKVQKPPEFTKSLKPSQEASVVTTEVKSMEPTNFTAMAEKARQEYLQKKTGQTLERKKKQSPDDPDTKGDKTEEDDTDNNNVNKKSRAPPPPAKPDRNGFGANHSGNGNGNGNGNGSPSSSGIGDLATIIAQKAAARQKSYEATSDSSTTVTKTNGNVGNGYQHSPGQNLAAMGVNTNSNNRNSALTPGSRQSVEIHGATLDSSNTEMFERNEENRAKALGSVLQRTQIFESQKAMLKKTPTNAGSKTVYRGDGSRSEGPLQPPAAFGDDLPPPMVPPPSTTTTTTTSNLDIVSNGHDRHGHETVGWVINSSPSKHSHEYAIRSKAAFRSSSSPHGAVEGGDVATVGHVYEPPVAEVFEVDFIPPPPLFESAEMNALVGSSAVQAQHEETASMVSSVSTLSTLSSTEQETGSPRQSYRSSYTPNKDSDNAPPPPPGFGDILDPPQEVQQEVGAAGFIPPPIGFELAGSEHPHPVSNLRSVIKNGAYQNKAIRTWSTADVCEWLDSIQLGALKVNFSRNKVTGQKLVEMGRSELIALGVTNVGDRMSIERAIKQAMMNS